jgi:DNA-binding XRE family transcriptional regulator
MSRMANETEHELVLLGYEVVLFGRLAELRKKVHLSRNAMSGLIGVDPESLTKWERLERAMNIDTALRIGEWFWAAEKTLNDVETKVDFDKMVPVSKAAQFLGMPQSDVEQAINAGQIQAERLGELGTFVYRSEVTLPAAA